MAEGRVGRPPFTAYVWTAVALGIALRCGAVWHRWSEPSHGDVGGFLDIARRVHWIRPWETEQREPLWILFAKAIAAPTGYSHHPLIIWSFVAAVGTVILSALLLRRHFSPNAVLAGVLAVAVHPLLVLDSSAGLRESTSTLLVTGVGWMVSERRWTGVAAMVAVLVGVRWELGVLAVTLLALAALFRSVPARAPLVAVLIAAVWMAPFMGWNAAHNGDPMYHSNTHAGWYTGMETRGWGGGPSQRPDTTWAEYYLSFLGPAEAIDRAVTGAVRVSGSMVLITGDQSLRHDPNASDIAAPLWQLMLGTLLVSWLLFRSATDPIGRWAVLAFMGGLGGYAALYWVMPYRIVSFLVLPLALMLSVAIDRALAGHEPPGGGQDAGSEIDLRDGTSPSAGSRRAPVTDIARNTLGSATSFRRRGPTLALSRGRIHGSDAP